VRAALKGLREALFAPLPEATDPCSMLAALADLASDGISESAARVVRIAITYAVEAEIQRPEEVRDVLTRAVATLEDPVASVRRFGVAA
jgi:hypothetical protein